MKAMMVHRLRFGPLSSPVALVDCPELLPLVDKVFRGWTIESSSDNGPEDPILSLSRDEAGYRLESACLDRPLTLKEPVDAVCGFIAELLKALVIDDPRLLCLHGAAVELGGRLVVFPNRYRTGKSTLTACFAAAGHRVFADDVLPIMGPDDRARAPGIAPRLRLPLPDDLGSATRDYLEAHAGPGSQRYLYLDLPAGRLPALGTPAPIGAFVLIERDPEGELELARIGRGETLRQVVWQNFGREGDAGAILRRLHRIVDQAGCYRLRYRKAEEAVEFLADRFNGMWPETPARRPEVSEDPSPGALNEVTVEGERFLAESGPGAIHHLNALASALWRLYQEQVAPEEMVELVHAAFPEVPRSRIERDVEKLLRDFMRKGLLHSSDEKSPPASDPGTSLLHRHAGTA
jgi:hypothetical protein